MLTHERIAFHAVPDYIPEVRGFWGPNGQWESWRKRRAWLLANIPSPRRQRLMAVVLALRCLPVFAAKHPNDNQPAATIDVAERYADGLATDEELRAAADAADAAAAADTTDTAAYAAAAADAVERRNQSRLLSLIIPLAGWSPSWQTESAVGLARGIYDLKAFDRLPVLADALDDANCDHPWLLNALRDPNCPGFRGMWVLDQLTGRD